MALAIGCDGWASGVERRVVCLCLRSYDLTSLSMRRSRGKCWRYCWGEAAIEDVLVKRGVQREGGDLA